MRGRGVEEWRVEGGERAEVRDGGGGYDVRAREEGERLQNNQGKQREKEE